MARSIAPFLMFEGAAEEAMRFYVSLFGDGEVVAIERYGADGPGDEGTVKQAMFRLCGRDFRCSDSPVPHAFSFTPSLSLFVECSDDAELTGAFARLGEGGKVLMPLDDYGFSRRFGWVEDRFGVSWQLNLAD
jgi:predicted 3-demethylubiquinone-9 3-methyltransferase (glyoxalase superfamily)